MFIKDPKYPSAISCTYTPTAEAFEQFTQVFGRNIFSEKLTVNNQSRLRSPK